ncbi:hypothetical protein ES703_24664 [subsurface metagenome]
MKKIPILLAVAILALACKKEAGGLGSQQLTYEGAGIEVEETRWLVVLHPEWEFGPRYERIDVTDWEPGEDVVSLGEYGEYYPWQGEDTIEFRFENGYLWVNGRRVGVNLGIGELEASDVENPEEIITAHVGWGQIPELKRFPNLITVKLSMRSFPREEKYHKSLEEIPEHVRVYVRTFPYDESWWQDPNITDENLAVLAQIKNLRGLNTISDRLTDLGMRHLRRCKNLRSLNLIARRVTSCGLKYLADLYELRELELTIGFVGNCGLRHLSKLANLRSLNLYPAKGISDAGLKHLGGLRNLRYLNLADARIRGPGLRYLQGLSGLKTLNLASTPLKNSGLKHLEGLVNLRDLDLSDTHIGDEGLRYLQGLTHLRWLWIIQCEGVSDSGVAKLQKALPGCKIDHWGLLDVAPSYED